MTRHLVTRHLFICSSHKQTVSHCILNPGEAEYVAIFSAIIFSEPVDLRILASSTLPLHQLALNIKMPIKNAHSK
jgi:hypothetical protein